jgi:hypothetical protein
VQQPGAQSYARFLAGIKERIRTAQSKPLWHIAKPAKPKKQIGYHGNCESATRITLADRSRRIRPSQDTADWRLDVAQRICFR